MKQKTDPVIEEIHQIRRQISDQFNGDLVAIAEDASRRQAASGRPVWRRKDKEHSAETDTTSRRG